jgi:type IV secretory pathway VirB4 component
MKFHGYMLNALIRSGHNEDAADAALEALQEYLQNREAELRAEGLHADAVWYARLRNEMCLIRLNSAQEQPVIPRGLVL